MNAYVVTSDTHGMVSDIHRNMLKCQEGTEYQRRLVSNPRAPFRRRMNKRSPPHRHQPGQRS